MSGIDEIEKTPESNLSQSITNQSPENPNTPSKEVISDFEKELFSSGTLDFDFDKYTSKVRKELKGEKNYTRQLWDDEGRIAETLAESLKSAEKEMIWATRFSGQIPKHWDDWRNIWRDFENAKNINVQLSEVLIDAGLSHPNPNVANEVGENQKLNVKQIAQLFQDHSYWHLESLQEILDYQIKIGVTEEDIQEAVRLFKKNNNIEYLEKRISGN